MVYYANMAEHMGLNPNFSLRDHMEESQTFQGQEKPDISIAADKIAELIYIDPLTGCYNGNFLKNYLEKFDSRRDSNTSIIFCDINNLKKTNDTEGHEAGDQLILDTVSFMEQHIRKGDLIVRPNNDKGDELLVICKGVGVEDRDEFESLIAKRFDQQNIERANGSRVNFAFGITHFDDTIDHGNLRETVRRADKLMYQKKVEQKAQ
ncbi:hypothetical protein SDC9_90912 [bioreactor metagenome]|uniref:GGDEF domain-containing protein n=1 Tax=bioreactor metagenome TaxID=1076179 RepID=A0A645A354_9ZZZZ